MRKLRFLSIVIPCHNEEETLPVSHGRLKDILGAMVAKQKIETYELIFVDNGSTDQTHKVLMKIYKGDPHLKVISLRRDFGYQGSISAGLSYAQGDATVTIDADLQDPPEKIEEMIAFYAEGYDLVLGVRKDRSVDPFFKRFFTEMYYRLLGRLGINIVYNHGDFRLMARSLVKEFNKLPERNRFIRAMILQLESRYAVVSYDRVSRKLGESKFNATSLISLSLDGITSFSFVPLRIAALLGFLLCLLTLLGVGWVFYIKVYTNVIPGWASTLLPIFALNGFQLLVLGLIGEYIGRLYIEVKQRPLFIVRKEYLHPEERDPEDS